MITGWGAETKGWGTYQERVDKVEMSQCRAPNSYKTSIAGGKGQN